VCGGSLGTQGGRCIEWERARVRGVCGMCGEGEGGNKLKNRRENMKLCLVIDLSVNLSEYKGTKIS